MVILNYVFIIFALVTIIKYIHFDCIILALPKILIKICHWWCDSLYFSISISYMNDYNIVVTCQANISMLNNYQLYNVLFNSYMLLNGMLQYLLLKYFFFHFNKYIYIYIYIYIYKMYFTIILGKVTMIF